MEPEEESDSYDEFAAPPEETVACEVATSRAAAAATAEEEAGAAAETIVPKLVPATSVTFSNNVVVEQDQKQAENIGDEQPPGPPPLPPGIILGAPPGPPDSSQPIQDIATPLGPATSTEPALDPSVLLGPGQSLMQPAPDLAALTGPAPNLGQHALDLSAFFEPGPSSTQPVSNLAALIGPAPNLAQPALDRSALSRPAASLTQPAPELATPLGRPQTLAGLDLPVKAPPAVGLHCPFEAVPKSAPATVGLQCPSEAWPKLALPAVGIQCPSEALPTSAPFAVGLQCPSEALPKSAFGLSKAAAVAMSFGTSVWSPPPAVDSIFAKPPPAVTSKSLPAALSLAPLLNDSQWLPGPVVGSTAKAVLEAPPPLLPAAPCWLPMTTGAACHTPLLPVPATPTGSTFRSCGGAPLAMDPSSAQLGCFPPPLPFLPPLPCAPFATTEAAAAARAAVPVAASMAAAAGPGPAACSEEAVKSQLGEPESWETIAKTGWMRVHTEKGFQYFFNRKLKTTSWTCPPEIMEHVRALDGALGGQAISSATGGEAGTGDVGKEVEGEQASAHGESTPEAARPTKAERAQRREEQVKQEQRVAKERDSLKNFRQMLMEKGVKAFDKLDKWLPKLIHDPRFTAVAAKERKALFEALAKRMDSERRKQAAEAKQSGRAAFNEILTKAKEMGLLDRRSSAQAQREVERRFSNDSRWNALPEKQRSALIVEAAEDEIRKKRLEQGAAQLEFKALVLDRYRGRDGRLPSFHSARQQLQQDKRWDLISSPVERERLFDEALRELQAAKRKRTNQQQRDGAEAEAARKQRRQTEAEEDLVSLLTERIKAPYELDWDEVRSMLRDNSRFRDRDLSEDQQGKIWEEYKRQTMLARRQAFAQLLAHAGVEVIGPEMSFEVVLKNVLSSPAGKAFATVPNDILRDAWEEWGEHAHRLAVEACVMWLRSCEHFLGLEDMKPEGPRFNALLGRLSEDVRFRRLATRPSEQQRLVAERLEELRATGRGSGPHGNDDDDIDGL